MRYWRISPNPELRLNWAAQFTFSVNLRRNKSFRYPLERNAAYCDKHSPLLALDRAWANHRPLSVQNVSLGARGRWGFGWNVRARNSERLACSIGNEWPGGGTSSQLASPGSEALYRFQWNAHLAFTATYLM